MARYASSSIGRAADSKSAGWVFESPLACCKRIVLRSPKYQARNPDMAVSIYKKGQGYWTRVMSAIAMGMLVLMGAVWLADHLKNVRIGRLEPIYTQAITFVVVFAGFFWLGYYLIGRKPKTVDFLIATENEMKKVNWSSRREIRGSTLVVIGLTVIVALIIAVLDYLIYTPLFKWINVLETAA